MGRLSEYEDAEVYLETAGRHEALGRRVEALLASEEPPESLKDALGQPQWVQREMIAGRAFAWFREQFIAPDAQRGTVQNMGSFATGGATGEDDGR